MICLLFSFNSPGKLCLQNENLAKKCIAALARELETSHDPNIRNNVIIIMCDLCVRLGLVIIRIIIINLIMIISSMKTLCVTFVSRQKQVLVIMPGQLWCLSGVKFSWRTVAVESMIIQVDCWQVHDPGRQVCIQHCLLSEGPVTSRPQADPHTHDQAPPGGHQPFLFGGEWGCVGTWWGWKGMGLGVVGMGLVVVGGGWVEAWKHRWCMP